MHLFQRHLLAVVAAIPIMQMASYASGPVNTEVQPASVVRVAQIHLRFIKPSQCLALLMQPTDSSVSSGMTLLPVGIDHVDTDDVSGVIMLSGTPAGIAKCSEFVGFFDVQHRRVELDVRFIRYSGDVAKAPVVVGTGKTIVENNDTADVTTIADHHLLNARLTPHINGDGSTSLKLSLTSQGIETGADGATRMSASRVKTSGYKRISTSGAPEMTLQLTDPFANTFPAVKSSDSSASQYTYFIEVNPTVLDGATKK